MSNKAVVSIVSTQHQANMVVDRLLAAGIPKADISVLAPDSTARRDVGHERNTKSPEGAVIGGSSGALLGGTLGALAGIGLLAIPGLGALIAAGPLVAALTGAAVGGSVGGITGGLVGLGFPEYEARQFEEKLKAGNVLIAVHTTESERRDLVKRIFDEAGVDDVDVVREDSAPDNDNRKSPRY